VRLAFAVTALLTALVATDARALEGRLLVFSKTTGYRHASIEPAVAALQSIAPEREWTIAASEDAIVFTDGTLAQIDVVLFMSTSDDILDDAQQAGLQTFVEAGGGFVGVHSASATEETWPWYRELIGARFVDHPAPQQATVHVVAPDHPACVGLPVQWSRFDEWYNFDASPSRVVDVLLQLDETTFEGGTMGVDHPIAWTHVFGDARVFYTGGGHTTESWADPLWVHHVANGIDWVIAGEPAAGDTSTGGSPDDDGTESATTEGSEPEDSGPSTSSSTTDAETTTGTPDTAETSGAANDGAAANGDGPAGCGCGSGSGSSALLLLPIVRLRRRHRPQRVAAAARLRRGVNRRGGHALACSHA